MNAPDESAAAPVEDLCANLLVLYDRIRQAASQAVERLRLGEPATEALATLCSLAGESGRWHARLVSEKSLAGQGEWLIAEMRQSLDWALAMVRAAEKEAVTVRERLAQDLDASILAQKGNRAYRSHSS